MVIFVPFARFVIGSNIDLSYPVPIINATYYLGYFVIGHILYERYHKEKNDRQNNFIYLLIFVLSTLITIICTYFFSIRYNMPYDSFLWYRSIFISLSSFMIFLLVITNDEVFRNKRIADISSLSFGVYLVHAIFIIILKKHFNIINYNAIVMIPFITFIIYLCSYFTSWIINKIPLVNKLIK